MGRARSRAEAEVLVTEAEKIVAQDTAAGIGSVQTFRAEQRRFSRDADGNVRVFTRRHRGPDEILDVSPEALENLKSQMAAAGLDEGLIRGANYTVRDDAGRLVRHYETNAGADVTTILHERFETLYKAGTFTGEEITSAAASLAALPHFAPHQIKDPGQRRVAETLHRIAKNDSTLTEAERRETLMELAVADVLGRFRDGTALEPGSIQSAVREAALHAGTGPQRGALQSMSRLLAVVRRYLGSLFGLARQFREARDSGALREGNAWDAFVRKLEERDGRADASVAETTFARDDVAALHTHSLSRPVFSSPDVMQLRKEKSLWRNPGDGREGFDVAEAEALISKYYRAEAFAALPKDAVLVPMPSTSGRNILPTLLAKRIAADHGLPVLPEPVAYPTATAEAKTKTSFWKKAADPVAYGPWKGLETLKAFHKPVVIVEDILNTGESWMAFADLLAAHGIEVVDVAAPASADPSLTSAEDTQRLAEKIAKGTGKPLAEVLPAVHYYFHGTFRPYFETAERAVANAHEARRLYGHITGAQSKGTGAGATQRRIAQENVRIPESQGHQDASVTETPRAAFGFGTAAESGGEEAGTSFSLGIHRPKARTDKPASWEAVRPGHAWNSAKRHLPNIGEHRTNLPKLYQRGTWEERVKRVAAWIAALPPLTDPWGNKVIVGYPQKGGAFPDPVSNRASHLIGSKAPGDPETMRKWDPEKMDWLGAVPDTIEFAQVRIISADSQEFLYFRRYKEGIHMVVVEKDGTVSDQFGVITQYGAHSTGREHGALVELLAPGHPGTAP